MAPKSSKKRVRSSKKSASLRGILKIVVITDKDIAHAKKSLYGRTSV
jgi:hypothetical protein